jgi:hypothetical protein
VSKPPAARAGTGPPLVDPVVTCGNPGTCSLTAGRACRDPRSPRWEPPTAGRACRDPRSPRWEPPTVGRACRDPRSPRWEPPTNGSNPSASRPTNAPKPLTAQLIADALDLHHRLPQPWARVEAGQVRASYARHVCAKTRDLTKDQAGYVDAEVAESADGRIPWSRFELLVEAKIAAADPPKPPASARRRPARSPSPGSSAPRPTGWAPKPGSAASSAPLPLPHPAGARPRRPGTRRRLRDPGPT